MKEAKPTLAWAIKHWTGPIYVETVSKTRRAALEAFEEIFDGKAAASGIAPNKAVKVEIHVIQNKR